MEIQKHDFRRSPAGTGKLVELFDLRCRSPVLMQPIMTLVREMHSLGVVPLCESAFLTI